MHIIFLDISIPRTEFRKWLTVNSDVFDRCTFDITWGRGIDDAIRIWVFDEGYELRHYDIERKDRFIKTHELYEKLNLESRSVFNKLSDELRKMGGCSCSCSPSLEQDAILFTFHERKEIAFNLYEITKELFPTHIITLIKNGKLGYKIYIGLYEIHNGANQKKILKPKPKTKKITLTLEEIAKKFNLDQNDIIIKMKSI